jgi:hypothetical protein
VNLRNALSSARPQQGSLVTVVCAVLIALLFGYIVLSHALTDGLCCGDDAAIALAAKNVAEGRGYSLPLNFIGESGHFPLHPGISTGSTLVLPAAALIWFSGPQVWAPSLVSSLMSLGLLALLACMVARAYDAKTAARYAIVLLLMMYALTATAGLFVHWYALLGEMVAILLLASAAWVASSEEGGRLRSALIAGLLAGLAVNSKLLALLGGLSIGGFYALRVVRGEAGAFKQGVVYTAGLVLPALCFEAYRLFALGLDGYGAWLHGMRDFFSNQVPGVGPSQRGPIGRAEYNVRSFLGATGLTWALVLVPVATAWMWLSADPGAGRLRRASMICATCGLVYMVWWLFQSNGWARYALIGLGLFVISAAWAVVALRRGLPVIVAAVLLLAFLIPWANLAQLRRPVDYAMANGFTENERVASLRAVGTFIDEGTGRKSVVAGSWWAPLVAVEYVSTGTRRTVGYNRLYTARPDLPGTLFLRVQKWDELAGANRDPTFARFARNCEKTVVSAPPFELSRCEFPTP